MKLLVLIIMMLLPFWGHSSSVLWDCYSLDLYGNSATMVPLFMGGAIDCSMFTMMVYSDSVGVRLVAEPSANMETCCAWGRADLGDVLDGAYFQQRDAWFYKSGVGGGHGVSSNYEIVFGEEEDVYLSVVAAWYETPEDLSYGWVRLSVDGDGVVSIVDSAFNVDGDPICVGVGSIPEPSSVFLLLIGVASISLRRRTVG